MDRRQFIAACGAAAVAPALPVVEAVENVGMPIPGTTKIDENGNKYIWVRLAGTGTLVFANRRHGSITPIGVAL